tara:strand:+ start:183 stop:464 length:282 start_codon:yes stop_codon:yes gene_type:complete
MTDERVIAVRGSSTVGSGTCSTIDECWTDEEILESLDRLSIDTTKKAVMWAIGMEEMKKEQALNCRWGEDSDPELVEYNDFIQKAKEEIKSLG